MRQECYNSYMKTQKRRSQKIKTNSLAGFTLLSLVFIVGKSQGQVIHSQESLPPEITVLSKSPVNPNLPISLEDSLNLDGALSPDGFQIPRSLLRKETSPRIEEEKTAQKSSVKNFPKAIKESTNKISRQIKRMLGADSSRFTPLKSERPEDLSSSPLFDGSIRPSQEAQLPNPVEEKSPFVINDDGVRISGKAAQSYQEARRLIDQYQGKMDLRESLGVMDDSYADVWAKIKIIKHVAPGLPLEKINEHMDETLTWLDGITRIDGQRTAIYTHRVFFHPAPNPKSEIEEGIRRVSSYIKGVETEFKKGGKAERQFGPLDRVVLGFDARGYQEIKDFLKLEEARLNKSYGNRFRFVYLDDIAQVPKNAPDMRKALNELTANYDKDSLQKISEGVIYSRYTGLLLELKTLEHYYKEGYQILQSGRELFDPEGRYITEIDALVKSPEGTTYLVEAKSSRVLLAKEHVLEGKVLYKLETYKKNQALIEKETGAPLNVVFAMDLGISQNGERRHGQQAERLRRQKELMEFLKQQAPILSRRYGFPVSFLFIDGGPSAR